MRWNPVDWIAWALIVIGGINWGLIGFANYNLVGAIFGATWLSQFVYALVGLGALWQLVAVLVKSQAVRT
ncbi:DUF378 domain-containing protein [Alicyclobacillus acidocaldarius]|uniref:DUF378 domain-containing protein n=1 Tax=Alicyclobacillus acidocaldarius subsp. acidocaldarius (strain ATCC 27009 / DSM 446 / BCRC 14685 / JCM 5260 / KCTC 1825 / NBRC 15652 / NCIMB 11725 / NRRL B-14509 / 104-IA) TaxID=521098 RepID=C8WTN3_ALIAD|nr:DUF378 domain-containing protein [Alicyclobacillus acidocaldarius]ACV57775.1 protein of unknown function DUF378 [Alicyclobacillus acidocaldarius subsp. acidocaldarius DSM 446]